MALLVQSLARGQWFSGCSKLFIQLVIGALLGSILSSLHSATSGSLEPAGRTPPAEARSKATQQGAPPPRRGRRPQAPAPGERSRLLPSNLSTNPLNPGKKTSGCVRHNAQDIVRLRGPAGTIPSVCKSQGGPVVAARTHLLLGLDRNLLPPSFSPDHVFFAAPGASLLFFTSGRRNGSTPFRLFPCHDLRAPWRFAGSVSPRRGYKQAPGLLGH